MQLHTIHPLSDHRWDELVASQPSSSVFHERGWLEALNRTYGYEPLVLTSTPPRERLNNGIVFCRVSSWITGERAVSLPFADHCEPLLQDHDDLFEFTKWLRAEADRRHWRYVEIRPLSREINVDAGMPCTASYSFHKLELAPPLEHIFRSFHKDSVQRRVRRAESEKLSYEVGRSEDLLHQFYGLLLKTRRRHRLVPQPQVWFRNLLLCMGSNLQIRVARKDGIPIAAILTLRHKSSVVYKYGCSDERFHNLAGMPFLFWKLIEESKGSAAEEIDFGRSDLDHQGLITFKNHFGTTQKALRYYRYSPSSRANRTSNWSTQALKKVFSFLPDSVLLVAGRVLYRHIG